MTRPPILALAIAIALAAPAAAQTAEEKGLAIARAARDRDADYGSSAAVGRMILRDRSGAESLRQFRARMLESRGEGDKTLIAFDLPRDIAGTALLTHARRDREDDQWLYLPSVKRVKRISSAGKTGSFAGSEFSYEDLVSPILERYRYAWLGDEPCPGLAGATCHVNQRVPTVRDSGYARHVVWLDTEAFRALRVHFFDRKNEHVKTLDISGYRLHEGRFWRADRLVMTNHQNGRSTVMLWEKFDFAPRLSEDDFTRRALEREE